MKKMLLLGAMLFVMNALAADVDSILKFTKSLNWYSTPSKEDFSTALELVQKFDPKSLSLPAKGTRDAFVLLTQVQFAAIDNNRLDIMRLLLDIGLSPDGIQGAGFDVTPLISAANSNRIQMVELLLEYGANVNKPSVYGGTALIGAVGNEYTEIVQVLLKYGADVTVRTYSGATPLMLATKSGNKEIIHLLSKAGARE